MSGTDFNGVPIAPMTYQLTIVGNYQPPPVTITDSPVLPSGTFETYYTYVFNVSGGSIPYAWSVVSGQLPSGLILESDITFSRTVLPSPPPAPPPPGHHHGGGASQG